MPVSARSERQQDSRDRGDEKQPAHLYTSCGQYRAIALRIAMRGPVETWPFALCRTTAPATAS